MRFYLLIGLTAALSVAYVTSDACVQCDSTKDPKCATNPEVFMSKACNNLTSKCYSRVLDGKTIRGCSADLDNATASKCHNEMECLTCSFAEGCNNNIFPQHRLRCLQCEGNQTSVCASNIYAMPSVCPIYKLGDKCYIRKTGTNSTESFQRGCLSSAQNKSLCKSESNCYTCEGNGCNMLNSTDTSIPLARDSAHGFGYSLALLLACWLGLRFL